MISGILIVTKMDKKLYTKIMLQISANAKIHIFQYCFIKKFMTFMNINNIHFSACMHLGSENIGQISGYGYVQ